MAVFAITAIADRAEWKMGHIEVYIQALSTQIEVVSRDRRIHFLAQNTTIE